MLSTEGRGSELVAGPQDIGAPTKVRVLRPRGRFGATVMPGDELTMPLKEAREWATKGWGEIVVADESEADEAATTKKTRAKKAE